MLRLLVIVALVCSTALSAATATQTVSFTADTTTNFPNPERGWHRNSDLINGGVSASMRNEGSP